MDDGIIYDEKWKNWEKYQEKMEEWIYKNKIWNYKQNVPDYVVEDVICFIKKGNLDIYGEEGFRDYLHAVLLARGVNKWLFVRMLLIRYKKLLVEMIREEEKKMKEAKKNRDWRAYHYHRGKYHALTQIRKDLKILCMTPRWIIWKHDEVGVIDFAGMKDELKRKWIKLYEKLMNIRFKK